MRVDARRKHTRDRARAAARHGELPAGGRTVAQGVPIRVPSAEPVPREIAEGAEMFAIESNSALALFAIAGLQLRPLFRVRPRIERILHRRLALLQQGEPGLHTIE